MAREKERGRERVCVCVRERETERKREREIGWEVSQTGYDATQGWRSKHLGRQKSLSIFCNFCKIVSKYFAKGSHYLPTCCSRLLELS